MTTKWGSGEHKTLRIYMNIMKAMKDGCRDFLVEI